MHILLTNDDGISAYGLTVLETLAGQFASKITVVAPATNQSGTGRSISLHKDIAFHQIDENRYQVGGTPADCVMLAMNILFKEEKPDLVLSGVNHGMNVGDDVGYSGTVGAAFEAAINGVPAIALSQQHAREEADFEPTINFAPIALRYALSVSIPSRAVLNINMPGRKNGTVKGIRKASLDTHKFCDEIFDGTQPDTFRIGPLVTTPEMLDQSDRFWLEQGFIAMTMLTMDANDSAYTNKLDNTDF